MKAGTILVFMMSSLYKKLSLTKKLKRLIRIFSLLCFFNFLKRFIIYIFTFIFFI